MCGVWPSGDVRRRRWFCPMWSVRRCCRGRGGRRRRRGWGCGPGLCWHARGVGTTRTWPRRGGGGRRRGRSGGGRVGGGRRGGGGGGGRPGRGPPDNPPGG